MIGLFRFKFRTLGEVDKLEQKIVPLQPIRIWACAYARLGNQGQVISGPSLRKACATHACVTNSLSLSCIADNCGFR